MPITLRIITYCQIKVDMITAFTSIPVIPSHDSDHFGPLKLFIATDLMNHTWQRILHTVRYIYFLYDNHLCPARHVT